MSLGVHVFDILCRDLIQGYDIYMSIFRHNMSRVVKTTGLMPRRGDAHHSDSVTHLALASQQLMADTATDPDSIIHRRLGTIGAVPAEADNPEEGEKEESDEERKRAMAEEGGGEEAQGKTKPSVSACTNPPATKRPGSSSSSSVDDHLRSCWAGVRCSQGASVLGIQRLPGSGGAAHRGIVCRGTARLHSGRCWAACIDACLFPRFIGKLAKSSIVSLRN